MTKNEFIIKCSMSNMNGQFSNPESTKNAGKAVLLAERLWEKLVENNYVEDDSESTSEA